MCVWVAGEAGGVCVLTMERLGVFKVVPLNVCMQFEHGKAYKSRLNHNDINICMLVQTAINGAPGQWLITFK